ncbi:MULTISPECIES: phosphoenolpyruvate synthase [Sphingomonadaceae]|jgi:pyruvate,water dikinase|uniref:Phosphoenolpyruvate synthase n=1 Tax=Sphingobium baderi LL03 TaxID=1114964 RepID=T0H0B3_9SPHN|nr:MULTISPECIES: phosphoenolpyruvate synthase [Sphingomonadaceae]EZP70507.1 Phosphoenolpyruvate synthase [Sphingomonas paucimobilis]AMK24750.1 phosphoenolpyruvate synthase [Sphingobium sp. TKS]EQB06437.1 phosphoenolpyruvate synthase [Sphingobium baderi LL03]KMS62988.1 phosphoenolpyruvate synthase [Sphingobium baderi LL03]WDA35342.1 phosphoenolpyruvate synthase [Sphingobium sp. YC-XJ3]
MSKPMILWFEDIGIADVPAVGGKNASLGEMTAALAQKGVKVPSGFATTADAYRAFVHDNELAPRITEHLSAFHSGGCTLQEAGQAIRSLFLEAEMPSHIAEEIVSAYAELGRRTGTERPAVAVRSSATAEDLPDASFAGQQETFLNVRGRAALLAACRRCFASLFTDRAISYRDAKGFDHLEVALSIGIQQMVRSDLCGSGVMFSIDTETGFPNAIVISAAWGLGETVVQGSVNPDRYVVFKPLLAQPGTEPIIDKELGGKAFRMVYGEGGSHRTRIVETTEQERQSFVLDNSDIVQLARWAVAIEDHYQRPMDMEWAKDGETGELYIVQARPETVQAQASTSTFRHYRLKEKGDPLLTGAAVGTAIAAGKACVIRTAADIAQFRDGSILITETTDPDWVPVMKRAAGIVTNHGGTTSHAAIVSRELGVPAIVGTGNATEIIAENSEITISCANGDVGTIYASILDFSVTDVDIGSLPATRTDIMVNIANPAAAFQWWRLPARGVGLARMEFIINAHIKVHPMALVHPDRVSAEAQRQIRDLTKGYSDPSEFFVDVLARGIAKLASPYYPHPAIVRLSDFKTNEYAHLVGGDAFEPDEENPMLGFRGASRYYDERYREGFALECRALKRVREELGFSNVIVMVPFCRTPAEADRVLEAMAENGLRRGENGLQIYMMCEIPSNVILAEQFATRFDGFSIGSNDLTQLVLGVDRDSGILANLFDERDEAVTRMISEAIRNAHAAGIKIGICGQGPSNHPDFAAFLVSEGIDSMSLNPDSFVRTIKAVAEAEGQSG